MVYAVYVCLCVCAAYTVYIVYMCMHSVHSIYSERIHEVKFEKKDISNI